MAERAATLVEHVGMEQGFAEIMHPGAPFHDRELFVVVMDATGTVLAHGTRPNYVGVNFAGLRDVDGKPFVADMLAMQQDGFVEYAWQNPRNDRIERKKSYIVHRNGLVYFVGAYQPIE